MSEFVNQLKESLAQEADPRRGKEMSAYMKKRFPFLGVQTPVRRKAANPLIKSFHGKTLAVAEELWELPQREYQYVACDLLRYKAKSLGAAELEAIFGLAVRKSWWDSVDSLAPSVGEIVSQNPELLARLDLLVREDNFWLRRIALIFQLNYKEKTDRERLFAYCRLLAPEEEFFIRKAIGWALRQYARVEPDLVRAFVEQNRGALSGLSVREALKHL